MARKINDGERSRFDIFNQYVDMLRWVELGNELLVTFCSRSSRM